MNRFLQKSLLGACAALSLAAMPVSSQAPPLPVVESTSSGLFTFSREERVVRVAAAFVAPDNSVVPTVVRFLDKGNLVLKEVRGSLSDGIPVIAELTRADVAGRGDLLVRVEVLHKLPGLRLLAYPIVVSVQPIGPTGSGSLVLNWPGGTCGIPLPPNTSPSKPITPGAHVMCAPPTFTGF
jgi:hypothetical protein